MKSTKQINIKDRIYYFYNDIIDKRTFDSNMLKVDKKRTKILIFLILDMLQLKILVLVVFIVLIVEIPYICVLAMLVDILKKKGQINV